MTVETTTINGTGEVMQTRAAAEEEVGNLPTASHHTMMLSKLVLHPPSLLLRVLAVVLQ